MLVKTLWESNNEPMFPLVSGLALGAVQGVLFPLSLWWSFTLILTTSTLFLYWRRARSRETLILALFLLGCAFGSWRGEAVRNPVPLGLPFDTPSSFTATVTASPDERESFVYLTVTPTGEHSRVRVRVPLYPKYHYGELLRLSGVLTRPESFLTEQGTSFDYPAYLARSDIVAEMIAGDVEIVAAAPLSLRGGLYSLIDSIRAGVVDVISEPAAALGSGMLLGGSASLGKELSDVFRRVGISHIVVLSGYNVTIVSEFLLRIFSSFSPLFRLSTAGGGIFLFVLATGASASSLRAAFMALTLLVARATGREYDAFRALLVAFGVMVLINPLSLTADPGFQLSVIATMGLIFLSGPIEVRLRRFIPPRFFRELVATTLAAQLAVLPLIIHLSGMVSMLALPLNVLVLPLVPIAMALTALSAFCVLLLPVLALPSAFIATLLLNFIVECARLVDAVPLSAITVPALSMPATLTLYTSIVLALYLRYYARPAL